MSWKIRHEGSPRSIEGLTVPEITQGLLDGLWEPTDEVMGPDDPDWVAIENHPKFSEMALDLEPPLPKEHDDETRLDMTALIAVTMVLLIFFILTTGYAALQKMIEGPTSSSEKPNKPTPVTRRDVDRLMIIVHVVQESNGDWGLRVEQDPVRPENLPDKLGQFVKATQKNDLLIDCPDEAPRSLMIAILDAAKQAGLKPHDLRPSREPAPP
jgi:biopolymer transport protein ExbD